MLVRFLIRNFLSFREETEFNMLSSGDQKHHRNHIYGFRSIGLLKTAALYGANGAGKSNFFKAIDVFQETVVSGEADAFQRVSKYKLDPDNLLMPTSFEIEFVKGGKSYLYGYSYSDDAILEEWLFLSGLGKTDEVLFHRVQDQGASKVLFSERYKKSAKDRNILDFIEGNLLKSNNLLIKVLNELKEGFAEVKSAFEWFEDDLIVIFPHSTADAIIPQFIHSSSFKHFVNDSLCSFHTGIESLDINTIPIEDYFGQNDSKIYEKIKKDLANKKAAFIGLRAYNHTEQIVATMEDGIPVIKRVIGKHKKRDGNLVDFYLTEESDGTNRLLDLVPAMFQFLTSESVVLIDEIDQSIHPVLLKEIVRKIVSSDKTKGQLIFSTHEANLLDQSIFRRDEIWFVEKDFGETKMYPLSDYDIRFDLDIRKGYLNGRFGAIPFIGNLSELNWNEYAEVE
jgi:uncharacterized protein